MSYDSDFDERYFFNQTGMLNAPIKLISPLSYQNEATSLQQNSSVSSYKSPADQHNTVPASQPVTAQPPTKRARGDSQPLKFVQLDHIPAQGKVTASPMVPFGADQAKPTQRRLQFNSSLNEITLREQLNQAPFPHLISPQVSNGAPHNGYDALTTPISQMMHLR